MFDLDKWQEILSTLKKNKLRTSLTSFSVAWGILLLIILLGVGNGFQNGIISNFRDESTNRISIWSGRTSMEHKGLGKDRRIRFTEKDYEILKDQVEGIEHIYSDFSINSSSSVSYKKEYGIFTFNCIHPDYRFVENITPHKGRFINDVDIQQRRKVAVIGSKVVKTLFKKEEPLGKFITMNGIAFKVVGVYHKTGNNNNEIFFPFSTAKTIFNGNIYHIVLTTGKASVKESQEIEDKIRKKLASMHRFNPTDRRAVYIYNSLEDYEQTLKVLKGINIFIWLIGIGTLIAGVVGVSNIMLIVVKERTREIGVRKAIGATPFSVVSLIISEAVFITTVAGYVGLVLGVGIMEVVNYFTEQALLASAAQQSTDAGGAPTFFMNPTADIKIAIGATILLIISGTIAGLIPAIKAAKIKPIEALRYE